MTFGQRSVSEALLVSLFPAVYLLKTLVERLNTVSDDIRS